MTATMHVEHDAGNVHLSEQMTDATRHPYRVAMTDGGAAVVIPTDTTWMQSTILHGMSMETLQNPEMLGRITAACWEMAECCRDGANAMRATASSGSQGMGGQMVTIVCGNCTINVTL